MTEKGLCVRHGTQSPNTAERLVYPAAPIKLYFIIARCEFKLQYVKKFMRLEAVKHEEQHGQRL
jgi:hypothetical protein|nr:MAG TPA: hypothetical protein [Caudoviricetes sp.]